jgi:RNA polymerase sigma-70 factor (ECF subfamily)
MRTDKHLVEAAVQGDSDAFGELVKKYSNALYAVAFGVLGDFHLAKDAAQETFLRAYMHLPTLLDGNKVGSWLYGIAYRLSIDWKRKQRTSIPMTEKVEPTRAANGVEEEVLRRDTSEQIWKVLNSLEETNRVPVILYFINEWSMREIADFLGITVRAVESRLQRSKKLLRSELSVYLEQVFVQRRLSDAFEQEVMRKIPGLSGIPCIFLRVRDELKAQIWYESVLGIDFNRTPNAGSVNIGFQVEKNPVPLSYPLFAFTTSDIKYARIALQKFGVQLFEDASRPRSFLFRDLDGNILSFMQA